MDMSDTKLNGKNLSLLYINLVLSIFDDIFFGEFPLNFISISLPLSLYLLIRAPSKIIFVIKPSSSAVIPT